MRLSCNNTTILLLLSLFSITSAFTTTTTYTPQRITSSSSLFSSEEEEGDTVLYSDEDYDDEEPKQEQSTPWKKNARWNSLNPRVKLRIIQEQQNKAIENKQKREPAKDKQRRLMMMYKERQIDKRRAARVTRPTPLDDRNPLTSLTINELYSGTVISLTPYGVYVDIGTECDGLLHISQISRDDFVSHPREVFSPGDVVEDVRVMSYSSELKKLRLSLLPIESDEDPDDEDEDDPIALSDLTIDDELWGEIRRVTSYGAYVELGAEVDGFLHFMDHPEFGVVPGVKPSKFMRVGDRIRTWVSDVDLEKKRVKLTANRPAGLPGPRREMLR